MHRASIAKRTSVVKFKKKHAITANRLNYSKESLGLSTPNGSKSIQNKKIGASNPYEVILN